MGLTILTLQEFQAFKQCNILSSYSGQPRNGSDSLPPLSLFRSDLNLFVTASRRVLLSRLICWLIINKQASQTTTGPVQAFIQQQLAAEYSAGSIFDTFLRARFECS